MYQSDRMELDSAEKRTRDCQVQGGGKTKGAGRELYPDHPVTACRKCRSCRPRPSKLTLEAWTNDSHHQVWGRELVGKATGGIPVEEFKRAWVINIWRPLHGEWLPSCTHQRDIGTNTLRSRHQRPSCHV
jgi:hypothetical protein